MKIILFMVKMMCHSLTSRMNKCAVVPRGCAFSKGERVVNNTCLTVRHVGIDLPNSKPNIPSNLGCNNTPFRFRAPKFLCSKHSQETINLNSRPPRRYPGLYLETQLHGQITHELSHVYDIFPCHPKQAPRRDLGARKLRE